MAAIVAGCSSSRFADSLFTGATDGAGGQSSVNQPMPPALVGNNPVSNGVANAPAGANAAPAQNVQVAALPPAGNAPANASPPVNTQPAAQPQPTAQSTIVTVTAGQTLYSLSREHGVSVAAIAAANGLTQTSELTIGQRLTIPAPGSAAALGNGPAPLGVISQPGNNAGGNAAPANNANVGVHVVQSGETMYSIAQRYGLSPSALAAANGMDSPQLVRVGQQLTIPGAAGNQVVADANPPQPQQETQPAAQPETPAPAAQPTVEPDPQPEQVAALPDNSVAAEPPATNGTAFRWPVNGSSRIISDFGPKPDGERNDGINISVPTGTEIHAAEGGVVIYAGNGIAGYGNLVLIEHTDNWVTAYAHASEILVSRDQTVQRGQVIARAGNTGSVTAPQLHFELRRGTVPVNPLDYLSN